MSSVESLSDQPDTVASLHSSLKQNVSAVIRGKDEIIDLLIIALVSEGHVLLEDVPGVGKTTLAKAMARSIDGAYGRVQFTPDLLPTDIIGVNIWLRGPERFRLHRGPVFSNVLLADEINRASPRTQSALLEAMAERQVTIDDETHRLEPPFIVLATQNPLDHEGTHPLPESQLDRFLMRISLGYPDRDAELEMLRAGGGEEASGVLQPVLDTERVSAMIAAARSVHIAPALQGYLLDLVAATRRHPAVSIGASPRASLALQRAARARAATRGRAYVVPDDVQSLAEPVLAHRILIGPAGHVSGSDGVEIVREIVRATPVPAPTRMDRTG